MKASGRRTFGRRFICRNPRTLSGGFESVFSKKNIDMLRELSYIPVAGKKLSIAPAAFQKASCLAGRTSGCPSC